jgi:hypothetical protein
MAVYSRHLAVRRSVFLNGRTFAASRIGIGAPNAGPIGTEAPIANTRLASGPPNAKSLGVPAWAGSRATRMIEEVMR